MKDSEVKIGMMVRVPDHTRDLEPTTSMVRVKRILSHKTREGEIIYETEQDVTDRFKRPYKCISQSVAKDMELIEEKTKDER